MFIKCRTPLARRGFYKKAKVRTQQDIYSISQNLKNVKFFLMCYGYIKGMLYDKK